MSWYLLQWCINTFYQYKTCQIWFSYFWCTTTRVPWPSSSFGEVLNRLVTFRWTAILTRKKKCNQNDQPWTAAVRFSVSAQETICGALTATWSTFMDLCIKIVWYMCCSSTIRVCVCRRVSVSSRIPSVYHVNVTVVSPDYLVMLWIFHS